MTVRTADGRLVCDRCAVARTPLARLRGLLGRRAPGPGQGLLLEPCASVHSAFLSFALDAVFLDGEGRVLRVTRLAPWRAASCRGARAVLELPAGSAIRTGERLELSG